MGHRPPPPCGSMLAAGIVLLACSPAPASPAATGSAPAPTPVTSTSAPAEATLLRVGPIELELPPAREIAGGLRIDPTGDRLDDAGILRYRFRSTVTVPGNRPIVSTYRATVNVSPRATFISGDGFTGSFELFQNGDVTLYRYPGRAWERVPTGARWRFSPAGPIPDYLAAGVIAQLTAERGIEVVRETELEGVSVTHAVARLADGLTVELWVSGEGVVMRERISRQAAEGVVVIEWEIHDVNGDFEVEAPREGTSTPGR